MFKFILLAILFPTIELYLLILIGKKIGPEITIALVIITGIAGMLLAKTNGKIILQRLRSTLKNNEIPTKEVIEGLFILVGAIFLIVPGFISDLTGFILVINFTRQKVLKILWQKIAYSQFTELLKEKLREELIKKGLLR